jgi:hypothetical protein
MKDLHLGFFLFLSYFIKCDAVSLRMEVLTKTTWYIILAGVFLLSFIVTIPIVCFIRKTGFISRNCCSNNKVRSVEARINKSNGAPQIESTERWGIDNIEMTTHGNIDRIGSEERPGLPFSHTLSTGILAYKVSPGLKPPPKRSLGSFEEHKTPPLSTSHMLTADGELHALTVQAELSHPGDQRLRRMIFL